MQPAIVRFSIHAEVGFHVMCGDRLLVQRVGGLWRTEKHNENIFAQDYFIAVVGCLSLPFHIGLVSVHSGSVKTLSSRERWWPISRQPAVPLPPGGYCPPLPAKPLGHLSQCHTLKAQKSRLWHQQSGPEINTSVICSSHWQKRLFICFSAQLLLIITTLAKEIQGGSVLWMNVDGNTVPLRRALFSVTYGIQQAAFIAFWAKWGNSASL